MKIKLLLFVLAFACLSSNAQNKSAELQKFSNNALFDVNDNTCFNVSGEWTGEEVQYDPTKSFIKVKFKVVFKLQQEGNRVFGTSYIEDKYRGSYGDMKIRGMVIGNKLHFEEYEIMNEKFFEKGVVWCLRSGEMTIKTDGNKTTLEGLTYNGYASDDYSECTDYAKMSVSRVLQTDDTNKAINKTAAPEAIDMSVYPNPFIEQATLAYELKEAVQVRVDVFSMSGKHIETLVDTQQAAGSQKAVFNSSLYAAGVYIVRIQAGSVYSTKQIVRSK